MMIYLKYVSETQQMALMLKVYHSIDKFSEESVSVYTYVAR